MKIELEISGKEDKRTVAAILVDNGYTVRYKKVVLNKRTKTVLAATKDISEEERKELNNWLENLK